MILSHDEWSEKEIAYMTTQYDIFQSFDNPRKDLEKTRVWH